jgi:hypothetical protein
LYFTFSHITVDIDGAIANSLAIRIDPVHSGAECWITGLSLSACSWDGGVYGAYRRPTGTGFSFVLYFFQNTFQPSEFFRQHFLLRKISKDIGRDKNFIVQLY